VCFIKYIVVKYFESFCSGPTKFKIEESSESLSLFYFLTINRLDWYLPALSQTETEQCYSHRATEEDSRWGSSVYIFQTLSRNASITIYNEFSPPVNYRRHPRPRITRPSGVKQAFQIYKPFLRQPSFSLQTPWSDEFLGSSDSAHSQG
jgi:hypothetical protein